MTAAPLTRYFSKTSVGGSGEQELRAQRATPATSSDANAKRLASSASVEPPSKRLCVGQEAPDSLASANDGDRDSLTCSLGSSTAVSSQRPASTTPPASINERRHTERLPPFIAEIFQFKDNLAGQFQWPTWLEADQLRDAKGRRPTESGYDQTSLWIPDEKVQKDEGFGTPMLLQYWKVKAAHFDKVALFKVGKFYELFFYDACIAQSACPLKWMGEKKPHVGFPEMAKHEYAKMIVDAGFKVVVIEQVERVAENKERGGGTGSCIERQACEIFTSGTIVNPVMLSGASSRFMLYIVFAEPPPGTASASGIGPTDFSACLVDCATASIQVGRFTDGPDRNALRTLLAQAQPSEAVYSMENLPMEVLTMLKRLPCRPQLTPLYKTTLLAARQRLSKYRLEHPDKISSSLDGLLAHDDTVQVAGGVIEYLESVLLGKQVLPVAQWEAMHATIESKQSQSVRGIGTRMVMDATALSALELLETSEGSYRGSLLEFLNHTTTPFGFRLLKQWLCAPLFEESAIKSRQDAVEWLSTNLTCAQHFREGLKKLRVDLERLTARVWSYSTQVERQAVMYEDVTGKRLADFMMLLEDYEFAATLMASSPQGAGVPSSLTRIVSLEAAGGEFPDLLPIITSLRNSVNRTEIPGKSGVKCTPRPGADQAYDSLCDKIVGMEKALEKELNAFKKRLPGVALEYGHRLPGFRYEVICDEASLPKDFVKEVEVNARVGKPVKLRFQTPKIKQLVAELENLEDRREDCIYPFLSKLFWTFYSHQAKFRAACRLLSELDVLLSLAAVTEHLPGSSCKAEIVPAAREATGMVELRKCGHPVVATKLGAAFVPNDVLLNVPPGDGAAPTQGSNILVVTGPNMGGKSTVLRQTCVAIIMAQLGCRVNAEACRLTPVDRIFTRIGSYDTILEGKSTLLCELEETAAILKHGTPRSLAVLDELGRGTSTFDGAAIAAATLSDLAARTKCLALFATHYFPVSREAASTGLAAPFHMAADIAAGTKEMTFLYKFLPGLCPASHGHNVAKLAGLPQMVLEEALARSAEFEAGSATDASSERKKAHLQAACKLAALNDEVGLRALFRQLQTAV